MVEDEIERAKVIRVMDDAAAFEKAGKWDEAREGYRVAAEMARKARLEREFQKAEKRAEFARLVKKAFDAERKGSWVTAKGFWQQARNLDPDHEAVRKAAERLKMPD
jgi:hypothetical protein